MKVQADGLAPFINRLEKFDKDVSKELKKEMRTAAREAVPAAQGAYPPGPLLRKFGRWIEEKSGRDLSYNVGAARKGIYLKTDRKRLRGATIAFGYTIGQRNAVGKIVEWAGKRNPTDLFNRDIIRKYGKAEKMPRFAPEAYYEVVPELRTKLDDIVAKAMRKVGR
ncbi:MAG TPA: hypothetical protein VIG24_17555 [Acidimicrobiia bacterium]